MLVEHEKDILSVKEVVDAPGLNAAKIDEICHQYCPFALEDRIYSPLLFEDWACKAKKAHFAICGWDPRRDEAILFSQILTKAGIKVQSKIYSGLPHAFWTMAPDVQESKEWEDDAVAGIRWLLEE